MDIVDKRPKLEATVNLFHRFVESGHTKEMPADYRHLYNTMNNIQVNVADY